MANFDAQPVPASFEARLPAIEEMFTTRPPPCRRMPGRAKCKHLERAAGVRAEHLVPVGRIELIEGAAGHVHAAVDEDVEPAELLGNPVEHRPDALAVRHVARPREDAGLALPARRRPARVSPGCGRRLPRGSPRRRSRPHDAQPDAAAAAGHQGRVFHESPSNRLLRQISSCWPCSPGFTRAEADFKGDSSAFRASAGALPDAAAKGGRRPGARRRLPSPRDWKIIEFMAPGDAQLDTTIEIVTPENIAFRYHVAGPFRRLPASLLDVVLQTLIWWAGARRWRCSSPRSGWPAWDSASG